MGELGRLGFGALFSILGIFQLDCFMASFLEAYLDEATGMKAGLNSELKCQGL